MVDFMMIMSIYNNRDTMELQCFTPCVKTDETQQISWDILIG